MKVGCVHTTYDILFIAALEYDKIRQQSFATVCIHLRRLFHSLEESISIFLVLQTVCQSVTNHSKRTTNVCSVGFSFYSFCKSLNSSHISYFRYVFTFFLLGCGLPGSGFDMDVKHGLEQEDQQPVFNCDRSFRLLIASQFDIPRKKGYCLLLQAIKCQT